MIESTVAPPVFGYLIEQFDVGVAFSIVAAVAVVATILIVAMVFRLDGESRPAAATGEWHSAKSPVTRTKVASDPKIFVLRM